MIITDIPSKFQPGNDPENEGPVGEEAFRDRLADDEDIVGPHELRGLTISEAENAYVGVRRAEAQNGNYTTGTKHARARSRYGQLLKVDRVARALFDSPEVGMQTLVYDPSLVDGPLGPVEQTKVATEGAVRAIRRTQERIDGDWYIYFGVRDIDRSGNSHWHVYWCVDTSKVNVDSLELDLYAGVEAHVRHTAGATDIDHPRSESMKWDPYPELEVESHGDDSEYGGSVHPLARYVAGSLPHLAPVGEMTPRQVRHGAVEWGSTSRGLKKRRMSSGLGDFNDRMGS